MALSQRIFQGALGGTLGETLLQQSNRDVDFFRAQLQEIAQRNFQRELQKLVGEQALSRQKVATEGSTMNEILRQFNLNQRASDTREFGLTESLAEVGAVREPGETQEESFAKLAKLKQQEREAKTEADRIDARINLLRGVKDFSDATGIVIGPDLDNIDLEAFSEAVVAENARKESVATDLARNNVQLPGALLTAMTEMRPDEAIALADQLMASGALGSAANTSIAVAAAIAASDSPSDFQRGEELVDNFIRRMRVLHFPPNGDVPGIESGLTAQEIKAMTEGFKQEITQAMAPGGLLDSMLENTLGPGFNLSKITPNITSSGELVLWQQNRQSQDAASAVIDETSQTFQEAQAQQEEQVARDLMTRAFAEIEAGIQEGRGEVVVSQVVASLGQMALQARLLPEDRAPGFETLPDNIRPELLLEIIGEIHKRFGVGGGVNQ